VLAIFVVAGHNDPSDALNGARAAAVLLVLALFAAGWALGGPLAAAVAVLVSAVSPFAENSARLVLSDAFGAALVLLILAVVDVAWADRTRDRVRSVLLTTAGALAGFGVLTRLSAFGTLLALMVATRDAKMLRLVAIGAAPFLIFLGSYQWVEFGSPFTSSYDFWNPNLTMHSPHFVLRERPLSEGRFIHDDRLGGTLMRWTCPCDEVRGPMGEASNAVFYPAVLLGLYWIYFPPGFAIPGIAELLRRRKSRVGQFAALTVVFNLLLLLPYFFQGARLVAPAAYVLLAFSAVSVGRASDAILARAASIRTRSRNQGLRGPAGDSTRESARPRSS
jgi:4-amino-4-deoxy-L-arabinose transferase-like glycosyltransferase